MLLLLLVLEVQVAVDVEIEKVLLPEDVPGWVDNDFTSAIESWLNLTLFGPRLDDGPDFLGRQHIILLLELTFILSVVDVRVRQHARCLVTYRLLILLQVVHELHVVPVEVLILGWNRRFVLVLAGLCPTCPLAFSWCWFKHVH